ncbi:Metallo-dependent phosphatase-like protein [Russula earlei]|uniref:Metallo-dependent phosphatase-like protein n=1 Tax=Russula earlei TaxID=71964 RepID=A0ACC0UAJ9_9AGAM|nr:Metallo-dependent phosphatase-like protein [Russula earlei]
MSDAGLAPPPTLKHDFPEDTIRILLATDNHIGYLERDPIRGQDSINTFREILQLAVKNDVDFLLLAGDLFHENRPSRDCLYQVMSLLREYTLGDKPVQIELLSDPSEGKAAGYSFPAINYEDSNLNVAIPVFSIHGNHDDPQGAGPEGALCALDMLSVAGLVNYIGKVELPLSDAPADGIAVRPVLLCKGNTHLGLYGIGNVKDARMHFELRSNRVRMYMPKDKSDWFNLLLLHQNRVKHGPQESVPEGLFDDSINLVVWGHEHDCRIQPEPVAGKRYFITQPGSSIATSLAEGEALDKHVALLKIQGTEFELTPIPLRTVRPFVMDEILLTEVAEENFDVTNQMEVSKYLKQRVNELIEKASDIWDRRNAQATEDGEPELPRMLPLVRLRVDTTGVPAMSNPIRFGQEFAGKIANPRDVLVFHRAKKSAARRVVTDEPELTGFNEDEDGDGLDKLAAGRVRVHSLVQEYLRAQEMQLLGEAAMSDAIQIFVEKDDIHAISKLIEDRHVESTLRALMQGVQASGEVPEENLDDVLERVREERERQHREEQTSGRTGGTKRRAKARDDDDAGSVDSMAMEVDEPGSDFGSDAGHAPSGRKSATSRGKGAAQATAIKKASGSGRKIETVITTLVSASPVRLTQVEADSDDEDEDEVTKSTRRTNRAAPPSNQKAGKRSSANKPSQGPARTKQTTLSLANIGTTTGRTSTRAAAGKARGKMADIVRFDFETFASRNLPVNLSD